MYRVALLGRKTPGLGAAHHSSEHLHDDKKTNIRSLSTGSASSTPPQKILRSTTPLTLDKIPKPLRKIKLCASSQHRAQCVVLQSGLRVFGGRDKKKEQGELKLKKSAAGSITVHNR